jgi:hypothetical protein
MAREKVIPLKRDEEPSKLLVPQLEVSAVHVAGISVVAVTRLGRQTTALLNTVDV